MFPRLTPVKQDSQQVVESLTEREKMIAARVAMGHSNAEIAGDLKISTQTVKNHLGSIFEKMGVGSRLELAAWLYRNDSSLCPSRSPSPPPNAARHSRALVRAVSADVGPDWRAPKQVHRFVD